MDAGVVNAALVQNLDLAETFLNVAGVAIPDAMQGRSLLPLMGGETPSDWRDAIYYQYFEYPGWHMVRRHYGIRTQTHKLIHYYEIDEWELFDLEADPDELHRVWGTAAYAELQGQLEQRLDSMRVHFAVPEVDSVPYIQWPPGG